MDYKFLKIRGALNDAAGAAIADRDAAAGLARRDIPPPVLALIPESVARENLVVPLAFDGETITAAAVNVVDIARADKLRFLLAKNVRLIPAPRHEIIACINRNYKRHESESVDSLLSEFTDTAVTFSRSPPAAVAAGRGGQATPETAAANWRGRSHFKKGLTAGEREDSDVDDDTLPGRSGMFFYTVEEGQRVLVHRPDGTVAVVVGPKRVWKGRNRFERMKHHVAHPDQFLIVRYRDGRQEHIAGPAELWFDPRVHLEVERAEALPLAAKEAVVAYTHRADSGAVGRRIVYGPALFVPQPGEWLHTFSWHGSAGGSQGVQKAANSLVFQKLWLLPDQMYHDVRDVRTADDAVLTVRLMIFFELADIERMLDATHDPIGDFVNAATSDVVEFTGQHTFEAFKRDTARLNDLETYRQLLGRAERIGYRITKVVYRGYDTAQALQQMHDQAIEARTRLQLDRATEEQAQQLEDYKLASQLARAGKRRAEQAVEVEHDLQLAQRKQEAELRQREAVDAARRQARLREAEQRLELRRRLDEQARGHLGALRELGVDLTAYLTQARADRVIELRGGKDAHLHLDALAGERRDNGAS
jgi:hypothetical protein